jgi:hypothetical protein
MGDLEVMKKRITAGIVISMLGLCLVTGCAAGKWKLAEIVPPDAATGFALQTLNLKHDGNFEAEALRQGKQLTMKGTYEYKFDKNTLKLDDAEGGTRTYNVEINGFTGKMFVWNVGPKKEWLATLERQW